MDTPVETIAQCSQDRLLTADEERALGARVQAGDLDARNLLVERNRRLAYAIAARHQGRGLELDDLSQEAMLGLIRAADKFDPAQGYRFSTYATFWIRQRVVRAIEDKALAVRLPVHMFQRLARLARAESDLMQAQGRAPSDAELAAHLRRPAHLVAHDRQARTLAHLVRLDAPRPLASGDDGASRHEAVAGPGQDLADAAAHAELCDGVRGLLDHLPARHQEVLRLHYGLDGGPPHTFEEVGRLLRLTRQRVSQIEREARERLCALPEARTLLAA